METREVKERTVTVGWTPVFDGGKPITAYRIDLKNKQGKYCLLTLFINNLKITFGSLFFSKSTLRRDVWTSK